MVARNGQLAPDGGGVLRKFKLEILPLFRQTSPSDASFHFGGEEEGQVVTSSE
jgi:hypothetical protein